MALGGKWATCLVWHSGVWRIHWPPQWRCWLNWHHFCWLHWHHFCWLHRHHYCWLHWQHFCWLNQERSWLHSPPLLLVINTLPRFCWLHSPLLLCPSPHAGPLTTGPLLSRLLSGPPVLIGCNYSPGRAGLAPWGTAACQQGVSQMDKCCTAPGQHVLHQILHPQSQGRRRTPPYYTHKPKEDTTLYGTHYMGHI